MLAKLARNILLAIGTFVAVNFTCEVIKATAARLGEEDAQKLSD